MIKYKWLQNHISKKSHLINIKCKTYILKLKYIPSKIYKYFNFEIFLWTNILVNVIEQILTT